MINVDHMRLKNRTNLITVQSLCLEKKRPHWYLFVIVGKLCLRPFQWYNGIVVLSSLLLSTRSKWSIHCASWLRGTALPCAAAWCRACARQSGWGRVDANRGSRALPSSSPPSNLKLYIHRSGHSTISMQMATKTSNSNTFMVLMLAGIGTMIMLWMY